MTVTGRGERDTETRAGEAEAVEAATHQMRMVLMGTGALTLAQVDEHAEPLARSVLGFVLPKFAAAVRVEHGEQIAQRIEVERANPRYGYAENVVLTVAARLAREAQS